MPSKGSGASLDDLIADVRAVHQAQGRISYQCYDEHGRYSSTLLKIRFGSFVKACEAAGLRSAGAGPVEHATLLADLRRVYAELGYISQDAYNEYGVYSHQTMRTRFGTWRQALSIAGIEGGSERPPEVVEMEPRRCLGTGPDHLFDARKDDLTHRICDACKGRTAPDAWDRITVADGWEVVGA